MNHFQIAIIGAGPAGMSAAIYVARTGKTCAIFESTFHGGQAAFTYEIENYPGFKSISGPDLMNAFYEHTQKFDVPFIYDGVTKIELNTPFEITTNFYSYTADKIIIATGAHPLELGIPSEQKFKGRGVSYCATCDASFYKEKNTVVVGGGNAAAEDALFLADLCEKVYMVLRRDEFRAYKALTDKVLENSKIEVIYNSEVEEFIGANSIEKAKIVNVIDKKVSEIEINGAFIAVGNRPNSELFQGIVALDEKGYVITNEKMETNIKGIYATGDVRNTPLRQVITATSDGAIAAVYATKVE